VASDDGFDSVDVLRRGIRQYRADEAELAKKLAARAELLSQLPHSLNKLLFTLARMEEWCSANLPRTALLWSKVLLLPPDAAAKDQCFSEQQPQDLEFAARYAVAELKETILAATGERILTAKASYDLDYIAAALALLCGWFATKSMARLITRLLRPSFPRQFSRHPVVKLLCPSRSICSDCSTSKRVKASCSHIVKEQREAEGFSSLAARH